jgi:FkbM family methyltransferase
MSWRDVIKGVLLKRNIVLSKPPGQFNVGDWKLHQLKRRGLEFRVIIDAGAAEGSATRMFKQLYPDAHVVAIEPRQDVLPKLQQLAAELKGVTVVSSLVGADAGRVQYFEDVDRSSILGDANGKPFGTPKFAEMTTLDALMDQLKLTPDFIKLDVQGAELQVLSGGAKSLHGALAVLMECSLIELQSGQPLLADIIDFMKAHGYQLYDILALWHRPLDGALAQGDFFFLKSTHPLLQDKRWAKEGQAVDCYRGPT